VEVIVNDDGRGRPILFLNGLAGLNEHWQAVVDGLRDHARCIRLQVPLLRLRGKDCSLEGVTCLTELFIERYLGARPAPAPILAGSSFGGHVAVHIALARPDLCGGLILTGSAGLGEKPMASDFNLRRTREWLKAKMAELFYDPSQLTDAEVDRAYAELSERSAARAMLALSRSTLEDNVADRLPQIMAPALVLWGRHDIITPAEAAEGFAAKMPRARLVWIDRCGHAPMLEKPAEFAGAVRSFLSEFPASG
jgi:2-hydroxy-6-oxonona-2,4-dienedioate hydrolase